MILWPKKKNAAKTTSTMSDLASYASFADRSRGRLYHEPPATVTLFDTTKLSAERSPFQRDRDRILHSGGFRRLQYKTQVFVNHEGDNFRTRLTHSLEVSQITRSLCRFLKLDEDLGEAIALAHDIGHTCFGHAGEEALHKCMENVGGFYHNDQTFRLITQLEHRYAEFDGLNLTWETLEGIAKHNGPLMGPHADIKKHGDGVTESIAEVDAIWSLGLDGFAGLEAQVAALADDIAYTAHDLDDGLRGGYLALEDLLDLPLVGPVLQEVRSKWPTLEPRRQRHEMNRRLINILCADVLSETRRRLEEKNPQSVDDVHGAGMPFVQFSDRLRKDERVVRKYLFENLYRNYKVNRMWTKAGRIVSALYDNFMEHPRTLPTEWQARVAAAGSDKGRARNVADYIAGMTDRYAIQEYHRLFEMDSVS